MSAPFINAHTHFLTNGPDTQVLYNLKLDHPEKTQYISAGIHPADIQKYPIDILADLLTENHCCAVGECGLDPCVRIPMDAQRDSFQKQILIAAEMRLPMVIHCVRCHSEILHFRKKQWHFPDIPWLIHGFRGKEQIARDLIKGGCLLSLSPVWIMHQLSWPDWLPYGSFLLETDESPVSIYEIYEKTAELKQESTEKVREELYKTFQLFLPQNL